MVKKFFSFLAKFLAFFFAGLTFAIIIISLVKPDWITDAIKWIGNLIHLIGNWNYLVAFLSACAESLPMIGTAVPGMNVMILVGGFWGKEHFVFTILLAVLGAMIGNYIGYWIGKYYGKDLIAKYGDWFGIGTTEAKILERQIKKNGFWYIVLGKFHNLTRSFVPFIAGGSGMGEKNFWLYNMIGSCLWAVSVNLLGIFFIGNYETILDHIGKIILGMLVVVLGYMYFFQREKLSAYMREKQAEIEAKQKR